MFDKNKIVRDFAIRTQKNLEFINNKAGQESDAALEPRTVFETTQLINSMLGLIVFPIEHYADKNGKLNFGNVQLSNLEMTTTIADSKIQTFEGLLRNLRNGITHYNIRFLEDKGEISGLCVWNTPPRDRKKKLWEAEFSLEGLGKITNEMLEALKKLK